MTRRFPRTEPLIPDQLRDRLIDNGRTAEVQDGFDPFPIVKLFMPDAAAIWLITEAYPEGDDLRLFGLPVERDLHFRAEHRLSTYAKIARHAGMIVT